MDILLPAEQTDMVNFCKLWGSSSQKKCEILQYTYQDNYFKDGHHVETFQYGYYGVAPLKWNPSIWPSVWLSWQNPLIWPSVWLSRQNPSVWPSVWLSIRNPSIWPSVWLSWRNPSIWPSIWLLRRHPSIWPSVRLSRRHPSVWPSVRLLRRHQSIWPSVCILSRRNPSIWRRYDYKAGIHYACLWTSNPPVL